MKDCAIIKGGVQDWQIFQQKSGFADISFWGETHLPYENNVYTTHARIISEENGAIVIPWQQCEIIESTETAGEQAVIGASYKWRYTFRGVPAGGNYRLETKLIPAEVKNPEDIYPYRGDIVHNIGVGDIFVIAGQSNASGTGRGFVSDPPQLGVHQYRNSGKWTLACHPMTDTTDAVHTGHYEGNYGFHSPFLNFAKILKKHLGYPIGLIQAAKGASFLREWNIKERGGLYTNMLEMIRGAGGSVSGVLWYQGESDALWGDVPSYLDRFTDVVEQVRKDLHNKSLPFLTVQLNRLQTCSNVFCSDTSEENWSVVREMQRIASHVIDNVYLVPTVDLTLSDVIHNSTNSNMAIGDRLARMALKKIYGKSIASDFPEIADATSNGNVITLKFINVISRLDLRVNFIEGVPFNVRDSKGDIGITEFYTQGNIALLTLERNVEEDCTVSYMYGHSPHTPGAVDSESSLPLIPFHKFRVTLRKDT